MQRDDPSGVHPVTAQVKILCKLLRLFSQPLVSAIRIKGGSSTVAVHCL